MKTKYCPYCKQNKSIDHFALKDKTKDIRQDRCKSCKRIFNKEYYLKNKQYFLDRNVESRKKITLFIKEYKLKNGCKICGYNKCARSLSFHHINNRDLKEDKWISTISVRQYSIERLLKEFEKCILVCANCHGEIHDNLIKL